MATYKTLIDILDREMKSRKEVDTGRRRSNTVHKVFKATYAEQAPAMSASLLVDCIEQATIKNRLSFIQTI